MSRIEPFSAPLATVEEARSLASGAPSGAASPPPAAEGASHVETELGVWQRVLLPMMVWMLVGLTLTFLALTVYQLHVLQQRIEAAPTLELAPVLARLDSPATPQERVLFPQWQTLAMLEQQALARRYHQANVLLMARTWTSYLGYLTGMILAMVGATFILGKLREEVSALGVDGGGLKANLSTTSPGLALCFLGTVLIMGTIFTHNQIEMQESGPLYLTTLIVGSEGSDLAPGRPPGDTADVFSRLGARILAPAETPASARPPADSVPPGR